MIVLSYLWYLARLAFWFVRFALYAVLLVLHLVAGLMGFGALPLIAVVAGVVFRETPFVQGIILTIVRWTADLFGDDWGALAYEWRTAYAAILCFIALRWAMGFVGSFIRPFAGMLPAPRRPLLPLPPLHAPRHVIQTVRVTGATPMLPKPSFRGELAQLAPKLPPHVRAILGEKDAKAQAKAPHEPKPAPPSPPPAAPLMPEPEPQPQAARAATPLDGTAKPPRRRPPQPEQVQGA